MSLLEIKDVNMNYHKSDGVTEALKDINFTVENGEFISIIGPSGCGKSTLLNIISGLLQPSSGEVKYNDPEVKNNLDKMGYMFQKDFLFHWLTVRENIMLGLKIKKIYTKENREFACELLKSYGLEKFANHKPNELSGGEQQRVALARALVNNPSMLIADEPTGNLDNNNAWEIMKLLEEINSKGTTVIVVTHNLEIVKVMKKRVITVKKGTIVSDSKEGGYDDEN